jgi:hypothetical protein
MYHFGYYEWGNCERIDGQFSIPPGIIIALLIVPRQLRNSYFSVFGYCCFGQRYFLFNSVLMSLSCITRENIQNEILFNFNFQVMKCIVKQKKIRYVIHTRINSFLFHCVKKINLKKALLHT